MSGLAWFALGFVLGASGALVLGFVLGAVMGRAALDMPPPPAGR